ncbi:MAG: HD-GYP domain-containing protein [bacterium]
MKNRQARLQSGVSEKLNNVVVFLIGGLAAFRLYMSFFMHETDPVVDGWLLMVTLGLVVYLWLRQSQGVHNLAIAQERLMVAQVEMITVLVKTIEAKDPYTHGHSTRVARIAVALASAMGLSEDTVAVVERAALLHDIGKLVIADDILHKTSPLTSEEWRVVKDHPRHTNDILSTLQFLELEKRIALLHHERYDGAGYGLGLKTDEIPIEASIISIADGFDAMNSERPYRGRLPREQVIAEIAKGRDTQYHACVVDRFLTLLNERPELWAEVG